MKPSRVDLKPPVNNHRHAPRAGFDYSSDAEALGCRVEAICEWPELRVLRELQAFLGCRGIWMKSSRTRRIAHSRPRITGVVHLKIYADCAQACSGEVRNHSYGTSYFWSMKKLNGRQTRGTEHLSQLDIKTPRTRYPAVQISAM